MSEEQKELLFDLLTKKAVYGLDEAEQKEVDALDPGTADEEFYSIEMTAAAISMIDFSDVEPMPAHLWSKISAKAEAVVGKDSPWPPVYKRTEPEKQTGSWFGWLGWAVAAAACIALAVNVFFIRSQPPVTVAFDQPADAPRILTAAEMRDSLLQSPTGVVKAKWSAGNVKELKEMVGDVVWSDEKQAGFMRFRGLPVNDKSKQTYQLWIFDKTQDKATPIDGGTFDVSADGEVIVPINAKLKTVEPSMFAITLEKAGGVVVSKREKIAALATVESKIG